VQLSINISEVEAKSRFTGQVCHDGLLGVGTVSGVTCAAFFCRVSDCAVVSR
jgi:hypothetical protein